MSKKLLSLALALVMCLGLTIPAFAAESKWKVEVVARLTLRYHLEKRPLPSAIGSSPALLKTMNLI